MTIPADQHAVPARQLRSGDYVYHEGRWMPVADVATDAGQTTVTLAPIVYAADEQVPVCAPLNVAKPRMTP
jgi:hypothetical protein